MKNILVFAFLLLSSLTFAQEIEIVEVEEIEENQEVAFSLIEEIPVYEGCQDLKSTKEKKACFTQSINKHVARKFNTDLANDLGLPDGRARIMCAFTIDKEGQVTNIRTRAPHPKLKEEANRILSLVPKMHAPGMQKGKAVAVNYHLPIVFTVVGSTPKTDSKGATTKD